jgi:hypothetical protein
MVFYHHVLCRSSTRASCSCLCLCLNGEGGRAICHHWRQCLGWIVTCEGEAPQQCHAQQ